MERANGILDVRDNGSIIAGLPSGVPLKQGLTVEKTFRLPEGVSGEPRELLLEIMCEEPERFSLSIDGAPPVSGVIRPGGSNCVFALPSKRFVSGKVTFTLVFSRVRPGCTAFLLADPRRWYGRTRVDGKELDGEIVSRLRLKTGR